MVVSIKEKLMAIMVYQLRRNLWLLCCEDACPLLQSRELRFANKFFPIQSQWIFAVNIAEYIRKMRRNFASAW